MFQPELDNSETLKKLLLDEYGTKASEKELNRRLNDKVQTVPTEQLLSALLANKQKEENQGQQVSGQPQQAQVAPQQTQGQPQPNDQNSMYNRIARGLMAGGAGLSGGDPSAVLKNLMEAQTNGGEEKSSLIAQRKASTKLMEMQIKSAEEGDKANLVYRDPVTGAEVSPEQAEKDMEKGLGIYQVNQVLSTRGGVREVPLNKVPDLSQDEKKYINDARQLNETLGTLKNGFESLYNKYGSANWQSFQMEKMPYILTQDQDVQALKSDLVYLKAAIPFLRGGKQLTATEAKRVDIMLNPFGKSKETYSKDIDRFEKEFMKGSYIMKFGANAGLMEKYIGKSKTEETKQPQAEGKTGFRVIGVR